MRTNKKEWSTPDKLTLIESWARSGLTDEQIARNMGITRKTLFNWRNTSEHIFHALKAGKETADREVENALYKRAIGYTVKEHRIEMTEKGARKVIEITHEVPPDVTACIYWLKNRKRDTWQDRPAAPIDTEDSEQYFAAADI